MSCSLNPSNWGCEPSVRAYLRAPSNEPPDGDSDMIGTLRLYQCPMLMAASEWSDIPVWLQLSMVAIVAAFFLCLAIRLESLRFRWVAKKSVTTDVKLRDSKSTPRPDAGSQVMVAKKVKRPSADPPSTWSIRGFRGWWPRR